MSRFKLLFSEALRSMGAEPLDVGRSDDDGADRDVPARPVRRARILGRLLVGPREEPAGGARSIFVDDVQPKQVNVLRAYLDGDDAESSSYTFVSKARGADGCRRSTRS